MESIATNKSCVLCGEFGIIPRLEKRVLTADLCSCIPRPIALPKLPEDKKKKFEYWKSKQAGHGEFELMKNPKLAEISSDEELEFKGIDEERIEILSSNKLLEDRILILEKKIKNINVAHLHCEELPPALEKLPKIVQNWIKNSNSSKPENLFLFGPNGTGKTTLGVWALYYAMILSDERAVFMTSDEAIHFRKAANTAGFQSADADFCRQSWEALKETVRKNPFLLIDDLGSQKSTESIESAYSEIIGIRYKSGLATIYTSNHWAENGIDRKKLSDKIGLRAADRVLGANALFLEGPSKRQLRVAEMPLVEEVIEDEIVDPERVKNFSTTGIAEGETTSPYFIAQNPVFSLVSNNERKKLTDAQGRDIAPPPRTYENTWHAGDSLTLHGPVLDQDDCVLLLALMEILHDRHRSGEKGLAFSTTIFEIRKKLKISGDGGKQTDQIIRRLDRLHLARVRYQGSDKSSFRGGFVEYFKHKSLHKGSNILITLNPAIIHFYENPKFFKVRLDVTQRLSYSGKKLYFFLASLEKDEVEVPYKSIVKLFGKENVTRRFLQTLKDTLEELKCAGLQAPEATFERNSILKCRRIVLPSIALSSNLA